ncbi:MAG: DNA-binding protein Alba [Candidatus Aenigmarchaeota archaeon]|nr:DNA-binding protein Alba [Candidatus Aenigmarchaeota archaeon]
MTETKRNQGKDNVVFVGKKPTMAYVLAVVTQFGDGHPEVFIKARGRAISKAVDVAEIVRNRFVQNAIIGNVKTGTETIQDENKQNVNVSTIELVLKK